MIQRSSVVFLLIISLMIGLQAQDDEGGDLVSSAVTFSTRLDPFGQSMQVGEATLTNESEMAYTSLTIFADLYNDDDEVIGEGFGVMVNACGSGLLPDFTLQPGHAQPYNLLLEFFDDVTEVARVEVFPQGTPVEPEVDAGLDELEHIRAVSDREVVNLEWIDPNSFRFAVGCDGDVFTSLEWFRYEIDSDEITHIIHPARQRVTDALRQQLDLEDPLIYKRSFLTFAPTGSRLVYQTDINVMLTAEPDGSFKRLIYEDLGRYSLQGFIWLPEGRFLAYYYGAIGDPVRYFTASVQGQRISTPIANVEPSYTVPGPSPDGGRAVVTLTDNGVTGYYLVQTLSQIRELLFEAEPPGNNWPAPVYVPGTDFGEADIYIARPVDGEPRLQCFDRENETLTDLSSLPLNLTGDSRAWMWLSPDGNTLALAANDINGGLWLVGLASLGGCDGEAE